MRYVPNASNQPNVFFGSSGGKSDAADPFLMVPRASFEICAKCVKSAQLFFFGPSGGKSDAADPFLIVPRSSFEISGRHVSRCLGGNREAKSINPVHLSWDFLGGLLYRRLHGLNEPHNATTLQPYPSISEIWTLTQPPNLDPPGGTDFQT